MKVKIFYSIMGENKKMPRSKGWALEKEKNVYDEDCNSRQNETVERLDFLLCLTQNQEAEERVNACLSELCTQIHPCNFGEMKDLLIREKII